MGVGGEVSHLKQDFKRSGGVGGGGGSIGGGLRALGKIGGKRMRVRVCTFVCREKIVADHQSQERNTPAQKQYGKPRSVYSVPDVSGHGMGPWANKDNSVHSQRVTRPGPSPPPPRPPAPLVIHPEKKLSDTFSLSPLPPPRQT